MVQIAQWKDHISATYVEVLVAGLYLSRLRSYANDFNSVSIAFCS